jgi:diguanylate cyclase (GGDEF)-like protein
MSSPVRLEQEQTSSTYRPPRSTIATELLNVTQELNVGLRAEKANLTRDVLLWQRWVRYLAFGTLVLLSLVFGAVSPEALVPLAVLAGSYVAVVMGMAYVLQRSPDAVPGSWVPSLMLAADVAMVAGFAYLTSTPTELHRILMLGILSVQLGSFYFGQKHGALAAAMIMIAYVSLVVAAPVFVPGGRPSNMTVVFNVTFFAIVSVVVVYTFGSFRERIDALQMYCKVVERGDTQALPPLPSSDQFPDELTLLARSFQSMHARLAEQVGSDALTGCLNRRSLEARLKADLRSARRRGSTVAVAAIDLDKFKEINDTRGHPVGDVVLQQVASIMKTTARDTDAVARFGGDEFVVVLPDTNWQGALIFADRLRRRVDDFSFGPPNTPPMGMTISVGVALGRGTDGTSTEGLLQEADTALYRAKTAGRNRVFS